MVELLFVVFEERTVFEQNSAEWFEFHMRRPAFSVSCVRWIAHVEIQIEPMGSLENVLVRKEKSGT